MNGAGNDFVVIDNRFYHFSRGELSRMASRICARRTGIGADGLLALGDPPSQGTDFQMVYFNADGSEGTMCGNGARCLARYAVSSGMPPGTICIATASGLCTAHVPQDPEAPVRVHVGSAKHWQPAPDLASSVPSAIGSVHFLWTGTEHAVCFVDDAALARVDEWGRAIRFDDAFGPQGTNVNFVQVVGAASLNMRTFEKGVEQETLACGTGALAAALAARYLGKVLHDTVTVQMPGGTLSVGVANPLFLEGPAQTVYRGSFEL